ncbi:hypothetical protein [Candidatus Solincola sp.]|jgi:hypothetical protein|nr:hypothetical protein [Actinomycetota bacterium]MDI7253144.1 hypothetical protein [Actinomycetota bacterium]
MIDARARRLLLYFAAALLFFLLAGCAGWQSGSSFRDEFDPADRSPVTAVKKWFKSMEWKEGEDGSRNPDNGRDFAYFLEVVNPEMLLDSTGQFIGAEQLRDLEDRWNSREWEVEFSEVVLEEGEMVDGERAVVKITDGKIRYIGEKMFGTVEYKIDSFKDKKGEIYLSWYEDPVNDPLLQVAQMDEYRERFADIAGKGRWVVVGGLDLSEEKSWGKQAQ